MAFAGAIAGLAGVNEVLGFRYRFLDNFAGGVGFLGIAVALLGRVRMTGVVAAALLFGALNAGAVEVDLFTEVPREIVLVVQAAILLFVVAADEIARRVVRSAAGGTACWNSRSSPPRSASRRRCSSPRSAVSCRSDPAW